MNDPVAWSALALLGALHGLNPAMGWLFAVALGLQDRSRAAVLRALGPIALGHAASIALVVAVVLAAGSVLDERLLRWLGAGALLAFGAYKLARPNTHPRWVGMRVGFRDLTLWSFLMSTAHGAGLMLVPLALRFSAGAPPTHALHGAHTAHVHGSPSTLAGLAAVGVHSLSMLACMTAVALIVYQVVGLAVLRRAWVNLDQVWALTLIAAGAVALVWR
ncbi:hypothetical protein [Deinococcus maricopensis]|uniref:Lysine exporter protein (LYSE/YGGA) n=1 Tax=Deinococcus maricopensis (strain DSM 21211 / LMG 22137 / NRRL B-23946 / LB-34) TaxID=709986 RepID=E8U349_DEIML|nr:hypothetical protein [Deinococcus maricopensis]ADV65994.1 hypothetical protein Deima_0333 [Deinococcus maricopensis DSM 21211]